MKKHNFYAGPSILSQYTIENPAAAAFTKDNPVFVIIELSNSVDNAAGLAAYIAENIRFFRCLPTSDTFVRKTYQILGVNPPLMHSFSNYILHELCGKCNYNFIL